MKDRSDGALVAGVELGGSKVVCLLATGPDDIHEQVRISTTTPEETLPAVAAVLARWRSGPGFAALGLASSGPLELDERSPRQGRIVGTPKPGWSGVDLTALGQGLGVPVVIDTDVNGAAVAEGFWGAAQNLRSFTYITVGTGVGVGSMIDGRPVRGLGHSEAGHLRVSRLAGDEAPGVCPYHGDCVEGLASGTAINARAGQPAEELGPGDPVWDTVVHALGGLMHNLVLTAAPERILIGGGVAEGQGWLLPRLRAALVDSLAGYVPSEQIAANPEVFVQPPGLGAMAGPLGAIALAHCALSRGMLRCP